MGLTGTIKNANMKYEELLLHPDWKNKRKAILFRDNQKCRNCGSTKHLQVHHRLYVVLKNTKKFVAPWDYKNEHLITLCDGCHKAGHDKYKVRIFSI